MKNSVLLIISMLLLCAASQAFAGDNASGPSSDPSKEFGTALPPETPVPAFRHGAQEVELLGGELFSIQSGNPRDRPKLDFAFEAIRYGWMFNDVHGSSFWRGNDEFLLEAFGGEVSKGPGNWLSGGEIILRHNFVQDGSRLVPYIQIGAGGLDNDIYRDQIQRRIGEAFEFTLDGGLGVRFMINDHWAIFTEADFRHISNADLASRNAGLDSFGGVVGLNFLF